MLLDSPAQLVISIDIEDWPQSTWDHSLEITARAARNTERVLEILAAHNCTITMFILGKFAERYPECVKRIAQAGHEIASHGYGHIEVPLQSPEQFREDVQRSKQFLEDLTGQPVLGYRAPDYSITARTPWALGILAELGFVYDSSIFPSSFTRYGIREWPPDPARVRLPSGRSIIEMPLTTMTLFGRQWPVAGGGYHRLLPWPVIRQIIAHRLRQQKPFITYCHPYEFDSGEFKELDLTIPLKTRLHQGLGRGGFRAKFEHMLSQFDNVHALRMARYSQWPDYSFPGQQEGSS